MEFIKAIDHLSECIKTYREASPEDGDTLVAMLQQITSTLFYLEKVRADVHADYQKTIHKLVLAGEAVNRSENKAHVIHPEMYLLRRVMDSAYTCCDAIRTQVSWIKSGLTNV